MEFTPIGYIHSDFTSKFGVPRQSSLVPELKATITFEKEYRDGAAFRGLESCSHIWLVWVFSECLGKPWSPTVRPPRLGGEKREGVFSTRSPFRPNPIGLSAVKLEKLEFLPGTGPVLTVSGADLMDGTPILDIKPYLSYTDSIPGATHYTDALKAAPDLKLDFPSSLSSKIPSDKLAALEKVLLQDPRPRFHDDPRRIYGMSFASLNIRFKVADGVIIVTEVEEI